MNYLTKWFLLDIVTVIPFDSIFAIDNLRYKRLLKLPRLMRLMNSMFQTTESKKKTRSLVITKLKQLFTSAKSRHILMSVIGAFSFIHVSACLWIFLSQLSTDEDSWLFASGLMS